MQTLAAGAVGLAIALVFAITAGSGEEATAASIFVQVLALISAPLFLLGFAPPPSC